MKVNNEKSISINKSHRIHLTDSCTDELIRQVSRAIKFNRRVVVAVPSYAMVEAVYFRLMSQYPDTDENTSVSRFISRGYLYQKHFDVQYEYKEFAAPWDRSAILPPEAIERIENTERWKKELEPTLSTQIFDEDCTSPMQIVIMLSMALSNPERIGELRRVNAPVIVLNPGVNDFQEFHHAYEKVDDKWVPVPKQRPEEHHYPTTSRNLAVYYITESELVVRMIQTSYERNGYAIEIKHSNHERKLSHHVTQIVSDVTAKRYSGLFPILFEHINKTEWNGAGKCIGDGIYSPYNFNRLGCSIDLLTGPIMVKLGQPHPNLMRSLEPQLGVDFQQVKKLLIKDWAHTVLSRVATGETIYFICDPYIAVWLREISQLKDLEPINVDVTDHSTQNEIVARGDPVASLLVHRTTFAATVCKSKPAFVRYVKNYGVVGNQLNSLIAKLLLAVTFEIREGRSSDPSQREFEFDSSLLPLVLDHDPRSVFSRLFNLCAFVINKYVVPTNAQDLIYQQYESDLREMAKRKSKSSKSDEDQ